MEDADRAPQVRIGIKEWLLAIVACAWLAYLVGSVCFAFMAARNS